MNGDSVHQLLGAYLLGGLDPEEERAFRDHLAACAECRHELEQLESLPALLDAVPAADAVALTVAGGTNVLSPLEPKREALPEKVLVDLSVRRRKSRRRWAALVGCGCRCLPCGWLPRRAAAESAAETGRQLLGSVRRRAAADRGHGEEELGHGARG